jgi:glyoxylase-like metal-dependent hydrolase (beta-lactamase superfamily II)
MKVETVVIGEFQAQSHIVIDEASGECAIVDTGENGAGIASAVERLGAKPVIILLTHGHLDHAGGLAAVRRRFPDVPIAMSEKDREWVARLPEQGIMFGVRLEPAPKVDRFLAEGETVAIGRDVKLRAIFTPGHTQGGITFFDEKARTAFVGDTLFQGSIGRTDLPGGSLRMLLASIREKLFPLGDDVVCYSGHGPKTTIGEERRTNPFLTDGAEEEMEDGLFG